MKIILIAAMALLAATTLAAIADDSDSMKSSVDPAAIAADPVAQGGASAMTPTDPTAAIPDAVPPSSSHDGVRTMPGHASKPLIITTKPAQADTQ